MNACIHSHPKVLLHSHLVGSAPLSAFEAIARRNRLPLDYSPRSLTSPIADTERRWTDFLADLTALTAVIRTPNDLADLLVAYAAQLAGERVIYAEIYCTPWAHRSHNMGLPEVAEGLEAGVRSARARYGVDIRILLDLLRSHDEDVDTLLSWMLSLPRPPFVGLGISGGMDARPLEQYAGHCQAAREAGLGVVVHAGELDGPSSLRIAIDVLGAQRIGHGIRAVEDADVLRDLIVRQIHLELCPTSNEFLRVVPAPFAAVEALVRVGVNCSINSDDDLLLQTSLCGEWDRILERTRLTPADLYAMQTRAVISSFSDLDTKRRLLKDIMKCGSSDGCAFSLGDPHPTDGRSD